jgi:chorismate dehydratase
MSLAAPSTPPPRVGSVAYLNALPLTAGIEDRVLFATPAQLARLLRRDELDAALVSVTEVLFNDRYDVLDGIAIGSRGPVRSVLLAHRVPLDRVRSIICDPASLTSVNLLRVLLAERDLHPHLEPLTNYADAACHDAVLLIGDRALDFAFAPHTHQLWDLGQAWDELTALPFINAFWALRRAADTAFWRPQLRAARDRGIVGLEDLIRARKDYTIEFRREYLTRNIRFELGVDEKRGLAEFARLLRKHGSESVFDPRYVE